MTVLDRLRSFSNRSSLCIFFKKSKLHFIYLFHIPIKLGEISKTYSSKETVKHLTNLQLSALISHAISPCSPLLFKWIDFKLFGMKINQYNAIGIFMAIVTVIYQVFVYFCLTNLTKEPGYKVFLKLEGQQDQNSDSVEDLGEKSVSIKQLISNTDIIVILNGVFLMSITYTQAEIYLNVLAITKFRWSIQYLGLITFVYITIIAVLMKLIGKINSQIDVNFLFIIMQITLCILMNLICVPLVFEIHSRSLQVGFFISTFVMCLVVGYSIRVLSNSLLFMIVPLSSRCVIVGIQIFISKASLGIGYFSASFLYENGLIVYPVLAILMLISALVCLMRSPSFLNKYVMMKKVEPNRFCK